MHAAHSTVIRPASPPKTMQAPPTPASQRGVTLIELMVGIAIGLLVIAVAMGALMVSRGVSGTVTDASGIQQQAAYAMRLFGQQLRQAGSMRLNLNPGTVATESLYMAPVAFETAAEAASNPVYSYNADKPAQTITGTPSPVTLTVGFRRYTEPVFVSAAEQSLSRNCLGGPDDANSTDQRLESFFEFDTATNTLRCNGNGVGAQPILQNVANFQVRYLLQDTTTTPGIATVRTVDAAGVAANWAQVQGVEVCLVLFGNEAIDLPAGSNYTDCDGTTAVDMSTLTGARARRMHMVFRSVFQLRSQGLLGSVLQPI
jgi:type IV pilus assembly protein PilW